MKIFIKQIKKLSLLLVACLGVVFAVAASETDKEEESAVCEYIPSLCTATPTGGNGGGAQPPPKD